MNIDDLREQHLLEAVGLQPLNIPIKLSDGAVLPFKAHDGDVGLDMKAIGVKYDSEHDVYIYSTGISMASPVHYGGFIFPRSSIFKKDAILCNHVPVIDTATYRGEILICFKNRISLAQRALMAQQETFFEALEKNTDNQEALSIGKKAKEEILNNPMKFAPYDVGDKIAQLVIFAHTDVNFNIQEGEWETTQRGDGGFGSTDKKKKA